jgi:calcium permeable stress-gated cation channel
VKNTHTFPRAAIARNVKDIPELIEEHEKAVRELEKVLAKYLKNPDNLPAERPMCNPSKKDKSYAGKEKEKVDAIDYLTNRIKHLEKEIREAREMVDKRNAMPYGFASYKSIDDAHGVAYAARHKHPQGSTLRLAPKPNDIIWKNLPVTPSAKRWQRMSNNLWVILLTILWIAPNALIAVFLANLSNLGKIWPAYQTELNAHPKAWAAVQGILSPAITSLFYFYLPVIFRRLSIKAGDLTKTSRERHVVHKLYAFFVFNNLFVFSLFAAVWQLVAAVLLARQQGEQNILKALNDAKPTVKIMEALCSVSPFWITWLLQRNLGAAIDLSQVVNLAWGSIVRKFRSPTPRELIEWTAPPPFDYASYYNYFLFYSTVALCFGTLQPVILPVASLYFLIDAGLKKYLLM